MNIIIVWLKLNHNIGLRCMLDTGATHTTLDYNALALSGYTFQHSRQEVFIETANGIIRSDVFEMEHLEAIGIKRKQHQIQVFDFVSHGITTNYDGILGLDFLQGYHFCVDTLNDKISIHE